MTKPSMPYELITLGIQLSIVHMDLIIFDLLTAQVIEVSSPDTNSNNFVIPIHNLTVIEIEFNSISRLSYLR